MDLTRDMTRGPRGIWFSKPVSTDSVLYLGVRAKAHSILCDLSGADPANTEVIIERGADELTVGIQTAWTQSSIIDMWLPTVPPNGGPMRAIAVESNDSVRARKDKKSVYYETSLGLQSEKLQRLSKEFPWLTTPTICDGSPWALLLNGHEQRHATLSRSGPGVIFSLCEKVLDKN